MVTYQDAAVGATILADTASDKPLILANNVIELANGAGTWIRCGTSSPFTGSWSGTDLTTSGYPTRLGYDRKGKLYTVASGATNPTTVISLTYRLTVASTEAATWDCAAIFGHNYSQVTGLTNVDIDLSDNEDFSANYLLQVASWTPVSGTTWDTGRLVDLSLYNGVATGRQFHSVNFVRVRHTFNANMYAGTYPRIGELWLGKRMQLTHWPVTPHPDRLSWTGESASLVADTGNRDTHTLWGGAGHREVTLRLTDSTEEGYIESAASLCSQWTKPIVWIEQPATKPREARIMRVSGPTVRLYRQGPVEKLFTLGLEELPPFRLTETGTSS